MMPPNRAKTTTSANQGPAMCAGCDTTGSIRHLQLLSLDEAAASGRRLLVVRGRNVVLATGGPSGVF